MNKNLVFTLVALFVQLMAFFITRLFYTSSEQTFFLYCLLGLVGVGSAILFVKSKPSQFIGRFMIATTVQMLSALSIIAATVYLKIPESFKQALLFILCFVIHLLLQSVYLVHQTRKHTN